MGCMDINDCVHVKKVLLLVLFLDAKNNFVPNEKIYFDQQVSRNSIQKFRVENSSRAKSVKLCFSNIKYKFAGLG